MSTNLKHISFAIGKKKSSDCSSIIRKLRTPFLWCDWRTSGKLLSFCLFVCFIHQKHFHCITPCDNHTIVIGNSYSLQITKYGSFTRLFSAVCNTSYGAPREWTGVGNQGLSNRIRGQSSTPMPVSIIASWGVRIDAPGVSQKKNIPSARFFPAKAFPPVY